MSGTREGSDRPHIFLTGFMGAGKSSVGKILADEIGSLFVDLDDRIVSAAGMPITEIFATEGEPAFRTREHEELAHVAVGERAVVATGGGVVLRDDNRRLMHDHGVIVNLLTTPEEVRLRLGADDSRPLLRADNSLERITEMLVDREPYYADADVRIDTAGKAVEEVVYEILVWLKSWQ